MIGTLPIYEHEIRAAALAARGHGDAACRSTPPTADTFEWQCGCCQFSSEFPQSMLEHFRQVHLSTQSETPVSYSAAVGYAMRTAFRNELERRSVGVKEGWDRGAPFDESAPPSQKPEGPKP